MMIPSSQTSILVPVSFPFLHQVSTESRLDRMSRASADSAWRGNALTRPRRKPRHQFADPCRVALFHHAAGEARGSPELLAVGPDFHVVRTTGNVVFFDNGHGLGVEQRDAAAADGTIGNEIMAAVAARMDIEPMREFIKADSLAFVSIDGLYRAVGAKRRDNACPQFCDACFTGDYPTSLTDLAASESEAAQLSFSDHKAA